jgi:hypothetical protein
MDNRGRIQAQGNNLEKSSSWDTDAIVSKVDGILHVDNVEGQLTNGELRERTNSLQKARRFINNCSVNGVDTTIKSFPNDIQNREVRVDVEVRAGFAFLTVVNN